MARPRDESLRLRLIEAATLDFATSGFAGSTLDGIARRAEVTKGGVYFHFRSKEELFFAALDHWRQLRRQRLQAPSAGTSGAAALRQFLGDYFAFHFEAPAASYLHRVLSSELRSRFTARLREDDRQEQRWLRATCRDLLLQGAHDGTLFVDDPAFAAFQLAASVRGMLDQWQTAPADVEAFCNAESLAQALVARYATGAPGREVTVRPDFDFGAPS